MGGFGGALKNISIGIASASGKVLIHRMESRNGAHILEHAETIGLGSQAYELVDLDA